MKKLILKSFAKLNLYLAVLNIRRDNYHNIKTLFERIDLSDKIILRRRIKDKKIKVISSLATLPKDNSNLAYRSAKLLQDSLHINEGVDIKILKRIPVSAGLGGGSSNAAGVLLGLNKLWKLGLSQNKLVAYAGKIGSDVPFFLYDSPFATGEGRGDKIRPLKALDKVRLWHILAVPKIEVSTPKIYKEWDGLRNKSAALTIPRYDVKLINLGFRKNDPILINGLLFNSLEQISLKLYPEIQRIKEKLASLGVKAILMSGSGPAVMGIVSSRKEAVTIYRQLKDEKRPWQVFVTRTS